MKNGFCFLLLFLFPLTGAFCEDASRSVMAAGDWYKIFVREDGIYRITYTELRNMGISDPAQVRIFGSGGAMLPELPGEDDPGILKEIPVWLYTGADGTFNEGDYLLFYGQGPVVWNYDPEEKTFSHSLHLWDTRSCYFITSQPGGKRIPTEEAAQAAVNHIVNTFDEHLFHEEELVSLLNSGRYWYGEHIRTGASHSLSFTVPNPDTEAPAVLEVSFMTNTATGSSLDVSCNNRQIASQLLSVPPAYYSAVEVNFRTSSFNPASDRITVELQLNGTSGEGWLNYIRLHVRRKLNMSSPQLFFRDVNSVGDGMVSNFRIENCTGNTQVWDITDMHDIKRINGELSGTTLHINTETGYLKEFVAFDATSGLLTPDFPEGSPRIGNQDLRSIQDVDMVIVTHPDFLDASEQLAGLHRANNGLKVEVVTAEQVYHEFSSGKQDPAAIRNFMKRVYENSTTTGFKYLLLMGDGSFDNKSNLFVNSTSSNSNFIVTYQSENSVHTTNSFVSDDYFGILDNETSVLSGLLRIGIGRLPVQTAGQALEMVGKIKRYMESGKEGDWPNRVGILADDGDNNIHTLQSESLALHVESVQPQYMIEKLYFDAYPQVVTADGHRYPEVEQQLTNLLNKGCLLVNYIGHGNESGLSEERVINTTNIPQWNNEILPLFIAATCEMGRYDNYTRITAGEQLVLNPAGGGIALLTSTRLVYSSLNFLFNSSFFNELFIKPGASDDHRLGDILRRAKNASGPSINKLCFTLLGDPALELAIPSFSVQTLSINGQDIAGPLDTLKANDMINVRGNITDFRDQVVSGFNGVVHFSLFDKPRETKTLNNDGNQPVVYFNTQTSVLYKGKATVKNGEFELSFVMPRDINYQFGFGKITYYAYSDSHTASGVFEKAVVGGYEESLEDYTGPEIRLFMNDTLFRDGGITNRSPRLIAYLQDESGINTSDEGIGHDITAILNNDLSNIHYLNPFYEAVLDTHQKGTVSYQFTDLAEGDYELIFTAWDVNNNSSQAGLRFRVTSSQALEITNLYNYPNPFSDQTTVYFEYNLPNVSVEAELQVFNMSGRMLYSSRQTLSSGGFTSGPFYWNGRDANGNRMKNGIYPYRIILRSQSGQKVWRSSKMVLVN